MNAIEFGCMLYATFLAWAWMAGVICAEGLWTILAVLCPPYAWYALTARLLIRLGLN